MKKIDHVYTGNVAEKYDKLRVGSERWARENSAIEPLLSRIPAGSRVLDIAAGTGRWLTLYSALKVRPILVDSSGDMLSIAKAKADELGLETSIIVGSALDATPFPEADWAVTTNFLNWISLRDVEKVLSKVAAAKIPSLTFMITYLPCKLTLRESLGARRKVLKNNFRSWLGVREKGIYHLHNEAEVRAMLARVGIEVAQETKIFLTEGRQNVVIEGRFT